MQRHHSGKVLSFRAQAPDTRLTIGRISFPKKIFWDEGVYTLNGDLVPLPFMWKITNQRLQSGSDAWVAPPPRTPSVPPAVTHDTTTTTTAEVLRLDVHVVPAASSGNSPEVVREEEENEETEPDSKKQKRCVV